MEDLRSCLVPIGFLYSLLAVGVNLGQLKDSVICKTREW